MVNTPPCSSHPSGFWTDWRPLEGWKGCNPRCLRETLDGGQAFRWNPTGPDEWTGVWGKHVARLRCEASGRLFGRVPAATTDADWAGLRRHLDLDRDYDLARDHLPWRSDAHLSRCLTAFPGLRILRQPLGETLLGFLCSATKQIIQIKRACATLAERWGEPLEGGFNALPSWKRIAEMTEKDLRACGLGFRARHIKGTADLLAERHRWLDTLEPLPYPEAWKWLLELPGVGGKVADCVLLFGAGHWEAFPVDVWIARVMTKRYGLRDWNLAQIAHFGRLHFGPSAGYAQQCLFAWEREHGRSTPALPGH